MRKCVGCESLFPIGKRERNPRKWCSDACYQQNRRIAQGFAVAGNHQCLRCGVTFHARPQALYCSRKCSWEYRWANRPQQAPRPPKLRPCHDCGGPLVSGNGIRNCADCSAIRLRERNRRKSCKRRGARYQRNYTLEAIAERDGWRCHLCHRKVNPTIPRTQPRGASIDHLIPIAHGGGDEPSNVALAHRSCNVRRSDKGTVQLRLVA